MSSFKLVFGKSCHLPNEIEHKSYWAIKLVTMDINDAWEMRSLQLPEWMSREWKPMIM